jgi:REP element-mobilizing transposase RayT
VSIRNTVAIVPRAPRSLQPDGFFHVTARGNRRAPIFLDSLDYIAYLQRLDEVTRDRPWRVLTFCLMPNHLHLVVDAQVERLSRSMQRLSGWYAQHFNRRHGESGHTFQGRFFSKPAPDQEYLLEAVRYAAMNPVRADLCERPQDWRWSGYASLIGKVPPLDCLDRPGLLALFGNDERNAIPNLRTFVELAEQDMSIR